MRRVIALLLMGTLVALVAGPASAATVDVSIVSVSSGFSPKTATVALGDTVHWTNDDSISHTTTQNGPLALWDSGTLSSGKGFSFVITAAGKYPYHCDIHPSSMKGSVKVSPTVTPASGSVGDRFAVTVASADATGTFVYDVQRRKGHGEWKAWKTGITSKSVTFKPKSAGKYSFRSRYRDSSGGASGWSPVRSISVS